MTTRQRFIVALELAAAAILTWFLIVTAPGCVMPAKPARPANPSPQPIVLAATVRGPNGALPDGVAASIRTDDAAHPGPYAGVVSGGRLSFTLPAGSQVGWQVHAHVDAPGLSPWDGVGNAHTNGELCPCTGADGVSVDELHLASAHVDPSSVPLEQLAAIRGAMWSARLDLPYGPRPGQPDNILATDFLAAYAPADQIRAIAAYKARGYTHVVVGPMVDVDGAGMNQQPIASSASGLFSTLRRSGFTTRGGFGVRAYHQQYPDQDWRSANFDKFLDLLQLFWDSGLAPIVFIHPDNWTLAQTQELTPLFTSERAQRLMRIIVPTGWEPVKYEWSSCTWAAYARWARQTWPSALVLVHTVSDVDAPVGHDDLCNDDDKTINPNGNGDGWARVAPYIHGWLIQNGPYPAAPAQDDEHRQPFCEQFKPDVAHTVAWEFAHNGWPQFSAWGGERIRLYNAENTAYASYWHNLPEDASRDWGDLAIACGADGYLDGGRVPVPIR